jgi:hypothetical protein
MFWSCQIVVIDYACESGFIITQHPSDMIPYFQHLSAIYQKKNDAYNNAAFGNILVSIISGYAPHNVC